MKLLLPSERTMIHEIENLTNSNYGVIDNMISTDSLLVLIGELYSLYNGLDDDFRAYERYVEDNYKQITKEEQIYG